MKRKTSHESILADYEAGRLASTAPSKAALRKFQEAARATLIKDRRVNVRLSSPDLLDIQTRAAEEGVPYQTLIASVLHKFVSGRFVEKPSQLPARARPQKNAQRRLTG
ncbi:MAG: hypothetical protein ACYC7G_06560 [Rudaea sp.]